jgi:DNA repair protein RecO (recombination protein O)
VTFNTPAFTLRSIPYGESDKILTLFTRDRGKVGAIARAAQRSRKRFGGALEPFALVTVALVARPGADLMRLERADVLRTNAGIAADLPRMGQAATALELTRELLPPDQPEPALFDALAAFLATLDAEGASIEGPRRGPGPPPIEGLVAFELTALAHAGLAPRFDQCGVCGKPLPPGKPARFDPRRGGIVCRADGGGPITLSARAIEALASLAAGVPARLPSAEAKGAAEALRALTEWHLGRALKSAAFLAQVS